MIFASRVAGGGVKTEEEKSMFENYRVFEYELAGRPLKIETGKLAGLANGSCLVRYGDTAILATATANAKPREGIDFLPLSVDFEERQYSVGKIPGGYFRREGKPSEKAILTSRVIDRPIRPLFPKDLRNDVSLNLTVMSVDNDCSAGNLGNARRVNRAVNLRYSVERTYRPEFLSDLLTESTSSTRLPPREKRAALSLPLPGLQRRSL